LILEPCGADCQAVVLAPRSGQIARMIHLRRGRTMLDSRCVFECPSALPACFELQHARDEFSLTLPMEHVVRGRKSASWVAPDGSRIVRDRWACVRAALNLGGRFDDPCRCTLTLESFSDAEVARDDAPWLSAEEAACTSWQARAAHAVCQGMGRDQAAALCEPLRTHVAVALEMAQQPTLRLPREVHATTQKLSREQRTELLVATLHERAQSCAAAESARWRGRMLRLYSWEVGLHVRLEMPVNHIELSLTPVYMNFDAQGELALTWAGEGAAAEMDLRELERGAAEGGAPEMDLRELSESGAAGDGPAAEMDLRELSESGAAEGAAPEMDLRELSESGAADGAIEEYNDDDLDWK
jgi:hypothetical protein